jgi:fibronectin-binding autotransporter adhesin
MASISWKGGSGDWNTAAEWSGGVVPGAADTVTIAGAGAYTVTLYTTVAVDNLTLNAPGALFYDAGALTLGGTLDLQGGTLDLAYGSIAGGTLAMAGGTLQASGGALDGVAVQGALAVSQTDATLFVQGGLAMSGAGGVGAGTLAVTGTYATVDFLSTQSLSDAAVTLGAAAAGQDQGGPASIQVQHIYGATSGATLTLATNVWLQQAGQLGQIIVGGALPGVLTDEIINKGTITAATFGGTLLIDGSGDFINAGTIGVSNDATLEIASAGFTNTGTITVANATLDFGGTFASSLLGQLGALTLTAATVEIGGDAQNAGATLTVGSARPFGPLLLAGTITGGTVLDSGGGLNFSAGTGLLDGVTYEGTLTLGAGDAVTLDDNTLLSAAGGGAGAANVTGAGAALLLQGTTTLGNATLSLGSNSGAAAELGTADPWLAGNATTATLGARLVVEQSGKYADIDANATTPIDGFGLSDTMINLGSIEGSFAGGTLAIGGSGTFINAGLISASNGDTLLLDPSVFSNTGTIALSGGALGELGGPTDVFGQSQIWSNSGTIILNGANLVLAGEMVTGQIGHIGGTGGTVTLAGTLANSGATLTLGAGGVLPGALLTGTITGGTIADQGGLLVIGSTGAALLDGVTDSGTLNLSGAGAYLRVRDGLTLLGTADVTGAGSVLGFQGSQTFDKAQIELGAAGSAATLDVLHDYTTYTPTTLTLGPGLGITQAGQYADIGAATDVAGDRIDSYAMIVAAVAGGEMTLGGSGFTNFGSIVVSNGDTLALGVADFANDGTISVTNAALSISDSVALSALGKLVLDNATVEIGGTLNIGGGTLAIGAGSAWGRVALTGEITGGTILDSGQGLNAGGNATLNDVTYEGVLDLSRPFQQLTITDGIDLTDITGKLPGTVLLTGAASRLLAAGNETINNATIYLGSASETYYGQHVAPAELAAGPETTLTLGATAEVRSAGLVGWFGDCSVGGWTDSIVNDGLVMAVTTGGIMTLGSTFFSNAGRVIVGNGGNLMFAGVGLANTGTISLFAGSELMIGLYSYFAAPNAGATPFSNSGTIRMLGGVLQELTGGGLFPSVAIVNQAGGLIQGLGTIAAPVLNNGLIEAAYGPNLQMAGPITGTGTLQLETGCGLELSAAVAASQTVSFTATGETLRLDQEQTFAAKVANFATGDALDIIGAGIENVGINGGGTLLLGTGLGQFHLATTAPLGGEISIGSDHHGGETVVYTAQAGGGTAVAIGVSQPDMMFWASGVGDIFTGTGATMAGAEIFNFGTADSLDFTNYLASQTTVSYAQASGQGVITVTDGAQTDRITVIGSYTASWFQVTPDSHGDALVTYSHT